MIRVAFPTHPDLLCQVSVSEGGCVQCVNCTSQQYDALQRKQPSLPIRPNLDLETAIEITNWLMK